MIVGMSPRTKSKALGGTTLRARIRGGVIEPIESLALPDGAEVLVTVVRAPSGVDAAAFGRAAGGWKGTLDAEALIRDIYRERLIASRTVPRL
jgi:hypothetical protein